jgi:hypothetical protein
VHGKNEGYSRGMKAEGGQLPDMEGDCEYTE